LYLYVVKILVVVVPGPVKSNLYDVNIAPYKACMTTRKSKPARISSAASSPARGAPPRHTTRASGAGDAPYHHGALRDALLKAAEAVLKRDGPAGLTLRAVAREAGVSHAAPTHHFGDLTGLLSELAAIGFQRFGAAMQEAVAAAPPAERGLASARAYVAYAEANPGMYGLMFRGERLDYQRPSLHEAAEASFDGLARSVGAGREERIGKETLSLDQAGKIVHAWSLVHGYSMLLLDGRLANVLDRAPAGTSAQTLLGAMLKASRSPQES
jgi:AcrR family transcriptional regulator